MVPIKTPEGQAELKTRQRRVSQRHRTVLLLVDGRRAETQVRSLALAAGVPESCFDELLDLGLIERPFASSQTQSDIGVAHVELPLSAPDDLIGDDDSLLPAAQTLQPESQLGDLGAAGDSWLSGEPDDHDPADAALEEARELLLRAVRAQAPMVGALTLLRLRRARSRADLQNLFDEVEFRISTPQRSLAATQTLQHARHLLAEPINDAARGATPP